MQRIHGEDYLLRMLGPSKKLGTLLFGPALTATSAACAACAATWITLAISKASTTAAGLTVITANTGVAQMLCLSGFGPGM